MIEKPARLRALAWLTFLGIFFFASYNFANACAAARQPVPVFAFAWERHIPFLAWTIVPYWSSDVLYALSFALLASKKDIDIHGVRLLLVQIVSVSLFMLFPLQSGFQRPEVTGFFGWLFQQLASFDMPFNQAPSLHVSLAVVLWDCYRRSFAGLWLVLPGAWFGLLVLSTLTTYQHQFIDLPSGAWLGWLAVTVVPGLGRRYWKLAASYGMISAALTWAGFAVHWLLFWPAFSFSAVAAAYAGGGPGVLGKKEGRMPWWMLPYELCARLNAWAWTRSGKPWVEIDSGVWLGRAPRGNERRQFASIVDMSAEMPVPGAISIPVLDLTTVPHTSLQSALRAVEDAPRPVLICCALGYARSAAVAVAWLVRKGLAPLDATERLKLLRPGVRTLSLTPDSLQQ